MNWTIWSNNSILNVPLNYIICGEFSYTIEFYDDQNQLGIPDIVMVKVISSEITNLIPEYFISYIICLIAI